MDTLRFTNGKLVLGDTALKIGDHIEVFHDNDWRAGAVSWSRQWQAFYIQLEDKHGLWTWEGLPVRITPISPGNTSK